MLDEWKKIKKIIEKYPNSNEFLGKISTQRIKDAQLQLGVNFPLDYQNFLSEYGSGNFESLEIYGIVEQETYTKIPNAIWITKYLREIKNLPQDYIVIGFDGFGGYYCLKTLEKTVYDFSSVVLWDSEESITLEQIADSFDEFLLNELKREIGER